MTRSTLKWLLAVVVLLVGLLAIVELSEDTGAPSHDQLLLPELKGLINEIDSLTVRRGDEELSIEASDGAWSVSSRGGYPADVGRIRELALALADARVVEEKTSNPESYAQLGVEGPVSGSDSVQVDLAAGDRHFGVIIGNTAQRSYRYVRLADSATSLMIDRNPDVPATSGDWLAPDVIDVPAARIRSIVIAHADGEEIRIGKPSADTTDFAIDNLPDGREPSYPTVANGLAGALSALDLEDVRPAVGGDAATVTRYETFDGLVVTASIRREDDAAWIGFAASVAEVQAGGEAQAGPESVEDASEHDPAAEAQSINARLGAWEYRVADYKANLMQRRWDDILKAAP